jgi:membrane protein
MTTTTPHFFSHAKLGPHLPVGRRARLALLRPPPSAARGRRTLEAEQGASWAGPLGLVRKLWERFNADRTLGLGAEMAFWLFLSLLPLSAVAGLITAKLAIDKPSLVGPMLGSLPEATRELLGTELGRVAAWNGGKIGVGAGLMFIWLASSGIHAIFDGIELSSEVTPRPWWRKRLLAVVSCVALSLGIALLALLAMSFGSLWRLFGGETLLQAFRIATSALGQIARPLIGAVVAFGMISGLYAVAVPPAHRPSTPVAPGALLAITLQTAIGYGYGFYLTKVGDGGAYQAGLASIGVTLMALYLFCLVLLIGVELNRVIGGRRRARAAKLAA